VRTVVCIPARYESTRFPGKMLANRTGKFLIQHTYEQACRAGIPDEVIIAADDPRIMAAAEAFGARCVLTSQSHQTGTDRIAEATAEVQAMAEALPVRAAAAAEAAGGDDAAAAIAADRFFPADQRSVRPFRSIDIVSSSSPVRCHSFELMPCFASSSAPCSRHQ